MPKSGKDITLVGRKLKVLVYGKAGTGKTTLAASFPKPYFFDFDDGLISVRGGDFLYDTFQDVKRNGLIVKAATVDARKTLKLIENGTIECDTIVIDSLTTFQDSAMTEVLQSENRKNAERQDWKTFADLILDFVTRCMILDKNFIMTAHEAYVEDLLNGKVYVSPYAMGKMVPRRLTNLFDEVYRSVAEKGKDKDGKIVTLYRLATKPDKSREAKSRLGWLSEKEESSYEALMANSDTNKNGE